MPLITTAGPGCADVATVSGPGPGAVRSIELIVGWPVFGAKVCTGVGLAVPPHDASGAANPMNSRPNRVLTLKDGLLGQTPQLAEAQADVYRDREGYDPR